MYRMGDQSSKDKSPFTLTRTLFVTFLPLGLSQRRFRPSLRKESTIYVEPDL